MVGLTEPFAQESLPLPCPGTACRPRPLPVWPGTPMPRLERSVAPSVHPELSCPLLYALVGRLSQAAVLGTGSHMGSWGSSHQAPCFHVERTWGDLTGGPSYTGPACLCPPWRSSDFGKGAGGPGLGTTGSGLGPSTCPLGPESRETQSLHSWGAGWLQEHSYQHLEPSGIEVGSLCPSPPLGLLWVGVSRVSSENLDQAFLALGGGQGAVEGCWVRLSFALVSLSFSFICRPHPPICTLI